MTGLKQSLSDLKVIVKTDRRVWSGGIFLVLVFTVWTITGAWRPPDEEPPVEYARLKVEEAKIQVMIKEFNKSMKDGAEERKFLKDSIYRVAEDVKVGTQEMDWHVNVLLNKLNDMTERVDVITNKVGASAVKNAKFEEKLKKQRKNRRKKKPIDRSML